MTNEEVATVLKVTEQKELERDAARWQYVERRLHIHVEYSFDSDVYTLLIRCRKGVELGYEIDRLIELESEGGD